MRDSSHGGRVSLSHASAQCQGQFLQIHANILAWFCFHAVCPQFCQRHRQAVPVKRTLTGESGNHEIPSCVLLFQAITSFGSFVVSLVCFSFGPGSPWKLQWVHVTKWALLSFAFAALHALCMPVPLLGSHEGSRRGLKHASLREVRVADNQHQLLLTDPPAKSQAQRWMHFRQGIRVLAHCH